MSGILILFALEELTQWFRHNNVGFDLKLSSFPQNTAAQVDRENRGPNEVRPKPRALSEGSVGKALAYRREGPGFKSLT